ncbi:uncharacterized protein LOC136032130 [Artemia franciscana]|uniref:uncharacterized protein LOC136032130 n=1 Tax=Artemia franciscana TaxID=6661 RepID=UPI0032DA1F8B
MKYILLVALYITAVLAKSNNPKEPTIDFQEVKRGLTANRDGSSFDDPSYRLRREASESEAPVEEDLKGAETHHYSYYPYHYYGHYYPTYSYSYPYYGYAPYSYGHRRYWG